MKKSLILIALAMVATLSMVSCKNNNKSKEPTQEEVQEQKQALADSVLAKIDEIADAYIANSDDGFFTWDINLTDQEKLVKPDYLLDPSEASSFITLDQKIAAVCIYYIEYFIRVSYGLPTEENKAVISKLVSELNFPIEYDAYSADVKTSDAIRASYNQFKERGETAMFWRYANAFLREIDYLLACDPELYLSKIGENNLLAYNEQWHNLYHAIWTLATYDNEIDLIAKTLVVKNEDEYTDGVAAHFSNLETAVTTYKSDVYKAIEKRNALLQ